MMTTTEATKAIFRRVMLALAAMALMALAYAGTALAEEPSEVLDAHLLETNNLVSYGFNQDFMAGQTFTAENSGLLTSAQAKLSKSHGSIASVKMEIFPVDGSGFGTHNSLASRTIPGSQLSVAPSVPELETFTFDEPPTLQKGKQYAFVLSATEVNGGPFTIGFRVDGAGGYLGGHGFQLHNDYSHRAGFPDFIFATYVRPFETDAPTLSVANSADGQTGWNTSSPVTLDVAASDPGSGLAGAPTCTDGTNALTLAAGSTAGTWTASVSGDGTHSISCTVKDNAFNSATASDTLKIDTTAPSVSCGLTPSKLRTSANNHKLVTITTSVNVTDSGSGPNGFALVSVTSNQADSALGKDDVPNDIQGWTTSTNDTIGQLRAERYGAERIYTLTYRGKDLAGNTRECQATVRVPKG